MTIKLRKQLLGGHVHIDVFVGKDKDHLARSGELVLRPEEVPEVESALMSPGVYHGCPCGKSFSLSHWNELSLVGHQPTEDDDGKPFRLELRNCSACGSTLACPEKT